MSQDSSQNGAKLVILGAKLAILGAKLVILGAKLAVLGTKLALEHCFRSWSQSWK